MFPPLSMSLNGRDGVARAVISQPTVPQPHTEENRDGAEDQNQRKHNLENVVLRVVNHRASFI
jgi:hypothetical protein